MPATIELSDSAMFELLTSALEAYTVKHQESEDVAIETVSHLWGRVNKRAPFKCTINHVSTETSAIRARSSVRELQSSLAIKRDIANVFGEDFRHIGTFHTHPWLKNEDPKKAGSIEAVRKNKLYNLSPADHRCEIGKPTVTVSGVGYSVALVMTMFPMERANDSRMPNEPDGLHEFSLGNIKVWLKGQVFIHKLKSEMSGEELVAFESYRLKVDTYSEDEMLAVPINTRIESNFINTLGYYLKSFGRIDLDELTVNEYTSAKLVEKRELHKI
ncbi:hypothetical protein C9J03_24725 [Photobacterium gaetbulicola]|uniref:Uncharacterized protein n=1 Tax=Photobacterium gaetbulicola Gung47 TaxID=658445 RepID=A0A0C5W5X3_9GAMM|nr:hypothetical protein [Photobacterium gaetbulicola]AJR06886.1 hypothetical protein H744_2c0124 [Photobacterium gaetbulicola Gung47]PSU00777.1 hypothetical protein C9J03_24725 [Photobacterium gaetbulicola]